MGAWLMTLITICIEVFCLQASRQVISPPLQLTARLSTEEGDCWDRADALGHTHTHTHTHAYCHIHTYRHTLPHMHARTHADTDTHPPSVPACAHTHTHTRWYNSWYAS